VLAADDYGVPQARKRLLIIAVRSDVADAVGMKGDANVLRLFPPPTSAPVSIRHAFRSLHQTKEHVRPWREAMWGTALHDIVRQLPRAPEARTRPADIGLGALKWFTLTRPAWDLPCPTLTVMGQKPDGLSGVIHPDEDRKFTIPELKRLTSLPEDFLLSGTLAQGVERICRMVPPLMIKAVADRVRDLVLTPYGEAANG
jgi:DNA (cytosine-5)-methyltransferase 1